MVASPHPDPGGSNAPETISDNDITSILMEGKRVLPSRLVEVKSSPDLPLVAQADAAGKTFSEIISTARSAYRGIKGQPTATQIDNGVAFISSFAQALTQLMNAIEALPPDSKERHRSVGEIQMPFAIEHWREYPPIDNGSLIVDFYHRGDPTETATTQWAKTILPFFNVAQLGKELPGIEEFIEQSKSQAPKLQEIRIEIAAVERRLEGAKERLEKAPEEEYDSASKQVARSEQDLVNVQQRIPLLFEAIGDVRLTDVDRAYSSLNVRIAPKDSFCKALCDVAATMERLVYFSTIAATAQKITDSILFLIPLPTTNGEVKFHKSVVKPEDMVELGNSAKRLGKAISTLKDLRDAIETTFRTTNEVADLASTENKAMKGALHEPIASLKSGRKVLSRLIGHKDSGVALAAIRLLETPAFPSEESQIPLPVLEFPRSFDLLSLVTSRYLQGDPSHAENIQEIFQSQSRNDQAPKFQEAFGVISRTRNLLVAGDLVGFAAFMNDQILELQEQFDSFRALGTLAILHGLTANPTLVRELRFQFPDLAAIKPLGKRLINDAPEVQDLLLDCVHDILCTYSQSLSDYYAADREQHLKEVVDDYRYYLRNQKLVQGIPANHVLKNSVAVYGPPGVGKSFFAQCLANELDDVILEVLSPGDKRPEQDQLAYVKEVFDRVMAAKSPVLLLIDEAETSVFHRMHPLAHPVDRERTNYILTTVDLIRKSYPNVFILLASNYPERVDEAMERHGRVDLVVYLGNPGPTERESIIRATLKKENVPLTLSAEEIAGIVNISDGFVPIQIIQAIISTHRLYIPRQLAAGNDIKWSFDLLKSRFERMANEDKVRKEKRDVMTRHVPAATSAPVDQASTDQ